MTLTWMMEWVVSWWDPYVVAPLRVGRFLSVCWMPCPWLLLWGHSSAWQLMGPDETHSGPEHRDCNTITPGHNTWSLIATEQSCITLIATVVMFEVWARCWSKELIWLFARGTPPIISCSFHAPKHNTIQTSK
jgi:hypothetical protein